VLLVRHWYCTLSALSFPLNIPPGESVWNERKKNTTYTLTLIQLTLFFRFTLFD
jgi:hypothetical protein